MLDALVSDLQAQKPDQIAVTGDLVNLALEAEFAPALAWLGSVGAPDRVSVVPGNHDAYVSATRHRFAEAWGDYLRGDDAPDNGGASPSLLPSPFPFLRRRGPLALIGVSSAVPTPPLMATGWLGRAQLDALERILTRLSARAIVSCAHDPSPAAFGCARQAADRFRTSCSRCSKRHGVELILHGHDHVHSTIWIDGPNGKIPAIGVPSASALAHGRYPDAAYNLFAIERDGEAWRCEQTVRGYKDGSGITELQRTRLM